LVFRSGRDNNRSLLNPPFNEKIIESEGSFRQTINVPSEVKSSRVLGQKGGGKDFFSKKLV
jgi:hypothetical protein